MNDGRGAMATGLLREADRRPATSERGRRDCSGTAVGPGTLRTLRAGEFTTFKAY
jgi:hypothetical protein